MKLLKEAKIVLEWDSGDKAELGTIKIEGTKTGAVIRFKSARKICQHIGWELVRAGMKFIFPGRHWSFKKG